MIIRFTPEADVELSEARQWYAHQRADLDIEFMEGIDGALSRIVNNPHLYPVVYRTLRRAVVRRFPFAVFYEVTADEIYVIAVFHSRRDPGIWKWRME
jgi:plasmid stabilization system protein ParE